MLNKQNPHNYRWQEIHLELKGFMQKEISLMRELLANMHQEEVSLMTYDKNSWNAILQDRFGLVQRLSDLRSARMKATKELESLVPPQDKGKKVTLEQILPSCDEITCEIMYLLDQIMSLIEKMNFQNTRNESLFKQYQHHLDVPSHFQYPPVNPSDTPTPKKQKAGVATYPSNPP